MLKYYQYLDEINNMSHKRKGQLTPSPEWCKHLRKYMRRHFWKRERLAVKEIIYKESDCVELKNRK